MVDLTPEQVTRFSSLLPASQLHLRLVILSMRVCAQSFSRVRLFVTSMECSLPCSSVHGIFQAGILEWVAMPSSRGSSYPGIKPASFASVGLAGRFFTTVPPGKPVTKYSVQFSRSVVSDSLQPHESQHARPPCPSPTPGVHPDSCPSSQ